jgi:hypothetical protein
LSICPRELAKTEAFERSRQSGSEMLFAHLKRILRLGRLRLRGPRGAQFEFTLAAIAQNLSRLAKLIGQPPSVVSEASGRWALEPCLTVSTLPFQEPLPSRSRGLAPKYRSHN